MSAGSVGAGSANRHVLATSVTSVGSALLRSGLLVSTEVASLKSACRMMSSSVYEWKQIMEHRKRGNVCVRQTV